MSAPSYNRLASIDFVYQPHHFVHRGVQAARAAGASHFDFWLGGRRVHVLHDQALARTALMIDESTRTFAPDASVWLGVESPAYLDGEQYARSRETMRVLSEQLTFDRAIECTEAALIVYGERFDAGAWVHAAATSWAAAAVVCDAGARVRLLSALLPWLEAADTPALMVPSLRPVSLRWSTARASRRALVAALASRGQALEGRHAYNPSVMDATIAVLLGAIDNPSILALEALVACSRGSIKDHDLLIGDVLETRPPVPLLLREVTADVVLAPDLHVRTGECIGVSTVHARMPFGFGEGACVGLRQARMFATAVLRTAARHNIKTTGEPVRRRLRLSFGATSVDATRAVCQQAVGGEL